MSRQNPQSAAERRYWKRKDADEARHAENQRISAENGDDYLSQEQHWENVAAVRLCLLLTKSK